MTMRSYVGAGLLALSLGGLAQAATCATAKSKAKAILPTSQLLVGLGSPMRLAAMAQTNLSQPDASCVRLTFNARGTTYTLTGHDTDATPRRAVPAQASSPSQALVPVVVLARLPKSALVSFAGLPERKAEPDTYFVLTSVLGTKISVWRIFDGIPSDATLGTEMSNALTGTERPLMQFDPTYTGSKSAAHL